jgi:hypothetical protein
MATPMQRKVVNLRLMQILKENWGKLTVTERRAVEGAESQMKLEKGHLPPEVVQGFREILERL